MPHRVDCAREREGRVCAGRVAAAVARAVVRAVARAVAVNVVAVIAAPFVAACSDPAPPVGGRAAVRVVAAAAARSRPAAELPGR